MSLTHYQRVTIEERARRYVAAMDPSVSGSGGHTALFNVVRVLLHGFDFTPSESMPFIQEFNLRCSPAWSEGEIAHKLRSVNGIQSRFGRGYLRNEKDWKPSAKDRRDFGIPTEEEVHRKVEFEPEKLQRVAGPWLGKIDAVWLGNRSAVDPAMVGPADFLRLLYPGAVAEGGGNGEKILCFTNEYGQGEALWPDEPPPEVGKCGVWFLPQPVSGKLIPNPEGKPGPNGAVPMSRRTWRSVTSFRYFVIESDSAPLVEWLAFIVQVPLRIEALYTSGSRSVHALIRVDQATKDAWDQEKQRMMPFLMGAKMCGADPGTWSAVRLSRLPGAVRFGKMKVERGPDGKAVKDGRGRDKREYERYPRPALQKLLYVRPNAPLRPLIELAEERDVVGYWQGQATALADGYNVNLPAGGLKRGLAHYAPTKLGREGGLRAALRELLMEGGA
jgi:hypothetical protein